MNIDPIRKNVSLIEQVDYSEKLRVDFGKELFIFTPKDWRKYFGDVKEDIFLPANIHQILKAPCPIHKEKAVWQTHGLMYFPETVNGEPLTLNLLRRLVKHPENCSRSTGYKEKKERNFIFNIAGSETNQVSCWALITNDILPSSRNLTYDEHYWLINKLASQSGENYEQTSVFSLSAFIFMRYLSRNECLYSNDPWTYARCHTREGQGPFVVGGFSFQGLIVYDDYFSSDLYGVAAMRVLS